MKTFFYYYLYGHALISFLVSPSKTLTATTRGSVLLDNSFRFEISVLNTSIPTLSQSIALQTTRNAPRPAPLRNMLG